MELLDEHEFQSDQAEAELLGAVAFAPDALAAVLASLPGQDFYHPSRGDVWNVLRERSEERKSLNPAAVARHMAETGQLNDGCARVIRVEMANAQPAHYAAQNARLVADFARKRELVQAVKRAYITVREHPGDHSETLAAVRGVFDEIGEQAEQRLGGTLNWQQLLDEFEAAHDPNVERDFISTPWAELNELIEGLFGGRMYVVGGSAGDGKALALDTPIPTPTGWTTMGAIEAGDQVLGADGKPTTVTNAWAIRHGRPCFEVEFSDGSVIVADAEHQWLTETAAARASDRGLQARDATRGRSPLSRDQRHLCTTAGVVTTAEIRATMRTRARHPKVNHSVRVCAPLDLPAADLLIPPYTLGVWLGDGTSASASFTSADPEIAMHIGGEGLRVVKTDARMRYALKLPESEPAEARACAVCASEVTSPWTWVQTCSAACAARFRAEGGQRRYGACTVCGGPSSGSGQCQQCWSSHGSVTARLRTVGVLDNKHIPAAYLRSSEAQRRALLAGLLDTDGTVSSSGQAQFSVTSERLAGDFYELAVSLGYRVGWTTKRVQGRTETSSTAYIVSFTTSDDVFRLERKRLLHKERRRSVNESRTRLRYIVDVRPVPSVPVRCIAVDNADHLFLAGRSMIPTHNSTVALNMAAYAAACGRSVLVFSKEMPTVDVTGRIVARGAEVNLAAINGRRLNDFDRARYRDFRKRTANYQLRVNADPVSITGVKQFARSLHHRGHLDLLIVDYLQLLNLDKAGRNAEEEIGRISKELKNLSMELGIPVVVPAQLNRNPSARADGRPTKADLRSSGQIEQDADVVILLWRRPIEVDPHTKAIGPDPHNLTLIVDKNRHGPKDEFQLRWNGGYGQVG
jgi:replicative DNA helicase